MNYKDLPLDERITLASQYALLLVADNKPLEEIIGILTEDYALTEEQAAQAFSAMRSNYKVEYNSTVRGNFLKALGALGLSLFAFLFYYFIGKGMGSWGVLPMIFAFVFALGALGALIVAGRTISDNLTPSEHILGKIPRTPDQIDEVLKALAKLSFLLFFFASCQYFFSHTLDLNEVVTVENCLITEPVRYESTGGEDPSYYYALKFSGHNLDFRFYDKYYKYSNHAWYISKLKEWDTVSIQLFTSDMEFFRDQYSTENVDVVNLGRNGRFLVDHKYRNAQINKSNATFFHVTVVVLAILMLLIFLKNLYHFIRIRINAAIHR